MAGTEPLVWAVPLPRSGEAVVTDEGMLSAAELQRAAAFADPSARTRYVLTRVALRRILGGLLEIGPARVGIGTAFGGKPILIAPSDRGVEFNYGHTEGLALIAVAIGRSVGVDVEWVGRRGDCGAIAARFFSVPERRFFDSVPAEASKAAFLGLWTRKEAVLKALGTGLAGGLDTFSVVREGDWLSDVACGGTHYRVRTVTVPEGYEAALALGTEPRRG